MTLYYVIGGRSAEYVRGYNDCTGHAVNFLKTDLNDEQKKELRSHLQQEMAFVEPPKANCLFC